MGQNIIQFAAFEPTTKGVSGRTMPMAYLVCGKCGHVRLYSSRKIGIPVKRQSGLSSDALPDVIW